MPYDPYHTAAAAEAKALYITGRVPEGGAEDWHTALREARRFIAQALRATNYLTDIASGLEQDGIHMLALRQLLAPPMSQDQFKLLCPSWNKQSEVGGKRLSRATAVLVAATVQAWLDPAAAPWLVQRRQPNRSELQNMLLRCAALIAVQRVATAKRKRLAAEQETAVVELLTARGWTKLPSKLIDTRAAVPLRHFMHKTRFATKTTTPQEVDIACGLKGTYVLAMECKVTNDETNSVKRVNDVLKKATAWKEHWGSFVHTAALLQGVVGAKDVQRLLDAGVTVFWSHELEKFGAWLDTQVGAP